MTKKNPIQDIRQIEKEKTFFMSYCNETIYGKYAYLISYFISTFRDFDKWVDEIFPLFDNIVNNDIPFCDLDSFEWGGKVCLRKDYILLLDGSIFQIGRKFPPLKNSEGEIIFNENGTCFEDTDYILEHYHELVKISWFDFLFICNKWVDLLNNV